MSKSVERIQDKVLIALGKYKYLIRHQFGRLKVGSANSNLNSPIKDLEKGKYVGTKDTATFGGVHFLLQRGADALERAEIEQRHHLTTVPKKKKLESYWMHRIYTVWYNIELDISGAKQGLSTSFAIRDFDALGSRQLNLGLRRATRVNHDGMNLEPDFIFRIKERLFVLETENQTDTDRSEKKMLKHCIALDERLFGKHFELNTKSGNPLLHRCLFVFTEESDLRSTMKAAKKTLNPKYLTGNWFLFKTQDEVIPKVDARFNVSDEKDFFENWLSLSEERVNMLS